jgi:hypothetical protein
MSAIQARTTGSPIVSSVPAMPSAMADSIIVEPCACAGSAMPHDTNRVASAAIGDAV